MAPFIVLPDYIDEAGIFHAVGASIPVLPIPSSFEAHHKLFAYHLNYWNFLRNYPWVYHEQVVALLLVYAIELPYLKTALEPYPTSLRLINWIGFICVNKEKLTEEQSSILVHSVYSQWRFLGTHIEYHLGGNHLLENYISLLAGAIYFQDIHQIAVYGLKLRKTLLRQLCKDGGHVERSPMYHQLILARLLDLYNLAKGLPSLEPAIKSMLIWLRNITLFNGEIPLVNDAFANQAPTTHSLFDYAKVLGLDLTHGDCPLSDSGYRLIRTGDFELFFDVGPIGFDSQPGHAHADSLQILLWKNGNPVLVETGTSTYEAGRRRDDERSTCAHNSVVIDGQNSSEVWGAFRVGHRADTKVLEDFSSHIRVSHNGYPGCVHEREISWQSGGIVITDRVKAPANKNKIAYFHFHPLSRNIKLSEATCQLDGHTTLCFEKASELYLSDYEYANHYGKTSVAKVLSVQFEDVLITTIT